MKNAEGQTAEVAESWEHDDTVDQEVLRRWERKLRKENKQQSTPQGKD